ncbi:hypothetical protein [Altererythrobacter sp. MTPC7]|uniref:hypothetical protein n=1 Tax=Altererythrobacter sp. MTPC7 TaxID=3056567 RepID=UPI0036F26DD2
MKISSAAIVATATLSALATSGAAFAQEADQGLTRAQFIAQMDAQFTALDSDQDGTITGGEIAQRSQQLRQAAALQVNRAAFQQLDTHGNGALSPGEFAALADPAGITNVPVPTVRDFDRDGDGIISLIEYRIRTQDNFDRYDQVRDGTMSAAEMQSAGMGPR